MTVLFDNKRRVDEDLESIRRRFLEEAEMMNTDNPVDSDDSDTLTGQVVSSELESVAAVSDTPQEPVYDEEVRVGAKDIFAMIIAVFSLIIPPLLVILAVMGLFLLLFFRGIIF